MGQENRILTEDYVRKEFEKYGDIEAIDLLKDEQAYITFFSDRTACLALLESVHRVSAKTYFAEPANTWHQPDIESFELKPNSSNEMQIDGNEEEYQPPIFNLNEDCLLKITEYCDFDSLVNFSLVCKQFYKLMHQYRLSRIHELKIDNPRANPSQTLAKTRQILRSVGLYITELTFEWSEYGSEHKLKRFLHKIGQYIGRRIQVLHLHNVLLDESQIEIIQPVLKRIHTLEIRVYNPDFELDMDFQTLCPKLKILKLKENMQLVKCCRAWPNLQYLSILGNEYMILETFNSFLEQNPQLKCLKFTAFHCDERFLAVAQHLKNVEKLTILPSFPNISSSNLVYLSSLEHLTTLNLMYLDDTDINGILECLSRFVHLKKLKLHAFFDGSEDDEHYAPNQRLIISLAQDLMNLEYFCLRNLKVNASTVLDFIRYATNLKSIHIHKCDLFFNRILITDIVSIRRTNPHNQHREPLKLFANSDEGYDFDAFNDKEILPFLTASCDCNHIQSE